MCRHGRPAPRHRGRVAAEALKHPQPRLQRPGPLDDHPVGGAAAEQPGDPVELAGREQAPADVLPRVPHLSQGPQPRGHLADPRPVPEHREQPVQQCVIGRWIVAAGRGPVRRRAGGQDVGQGGGGQADTQVEPGQVAGQHPDQRPDRQPPGQRDQVTGDGGLGQVDDRERVPAGQPRHGHAGQQRRPAGHGAADQVDPVDLAGQHHGVPQRLPAERALAALPGPEPAGMLLLRGEQLAFLRRAGGGDPAPLRRDGGLQRLPAAPDRGRGRHGQPPERRRARHGERRVQPAPAVTAAAGTWPGCRAAAAPAARASGC